jgi:hypothetical protein
VKLTTFLSLVRICPICNQILPKPEEPQKNIQSNHTSNFLTAYLEDQYGECYTHFLYRAVRRKGSLHVVEAWVYYDDLIVSLTMNTIHNVFYCEISVQSKDQSFLHSVSKEGMEEILPNLKNIRAYSLLL